MAQTCPKCGSGVSGRICRFCGSLTRELESPADEEAAIAELHDAIAEAGDDKAKAELLSNGPLPDDHDVLIDAGLRAAQLLDAKAYADLAPHAAARRVQAVRTKLSIAGGNERALHELDTLLNAFRARLVIEEREGTRIVLGCLIVALVVAGLVALALLVWKAR